MLGSDSELNVGAKKKKKSICCIVCTRVKVKPLPWSQLCRLYQWPGCGKRPLYRSWWLDRLLLWSPDRYTQHVSQVLAHHLPGAEKMVREWKREQGEVEGNKGATKKPKLSACLSLGFETDIQRPVSCLFHMHLHCFWRWQNLSACGTPLTVSKVPQFHVEQGCNIVICYSCHTKFRNHIS